MGKRVLLVDVQRIHIRTQRNRVPTLLQSAQGADDARARDTAFDRETERLQAFGDERRLLCSSNAVSGWAWI